MGKRKLFDDGSVETIVVPAEKRIISVEVNEVDGVDYLFVYTEPRPASAGKTLASIEITR